MNSRAGHCHIAMGKGTLQSPGDVYSRMYEKAELQTAGIQHALATQSTEIRQEVTQKESEQYSKTVKR